MFIPIHIYLFAYIYTVSTFGLQVCGAFFDADMRVRAAACDALGGLHALYKPFTRFSHRHN